MADFALHSGASGPFVSVSANGQKLYHSPRGKLFAIDADGQHLLTCAPHGGLIYKVGSHFTSSKLYMSYTMMKHMHSGENKKYFTIMCGKSVCLSVSPL